jgi:putative membrane protein insertion efficiency factor
LSLTIDHLFDTARNVPRNTGRGLVKVYRYTLSPLVGFECRHLPTCSDYADDALARHGLWAGGWMTLARLCRCHPLGTRGLDFVPDASPARARWYLPWRYGRWRGVNDAVADDRHPGSREVAVRKP